ncbi:hypothetical protein [Nonomuraea insulae]|uniref:4,5-dihydroxyphthalate decarboxylase n=1 Tax=Nonomuraea insulae TaxID=1616787 RepID=A0ABW1DCJ7_9ACTN
MNTYTVAVRNYAHTTPLKSGERQVENCRLEFPQIDPIYKAFAPMVRELKFDVSEMAIATYLQAKDAGKQISLLPVAMNGDFHHHSISHWPGAPIRSPKDLVGRRVGVRAYTQTTGLWVRGVLKEDYGVEADQITWVTTEGPHVDEYVEPPNVERTSSKILDLLRDGDIVAAVRGPVVIDNDGASLVPVIKNWQEAEQAWSERHSTVPMNHMLTVRTDLLKNDPKAVRSIYEAFTAGIDMVPTDGPRTSRQRAVRYGLSEELLSALRLAVRYAYEQRLIRSEFAVEDLFADFIECLDA